MTVTYTLSVSEAKFWGFPRLLARWRGSIYKLMYKEMLFFLAIYYLLAVSYRWIFNAKLQRQFEIAARYCQEFTSVVPITFVLGFYVTFIVGRWWQQYMAVPWPDRVAIQIAAYVQGADERGRMIRRAMIRYVNQISVLTFMYTSTVIKSRFPTLDHLVEAGIMTPEEKAELDNLETPHGIWFVPSSWYANMAMLARKEGRIHDDLHLKSLIDEMLVFRGHCGTVWSYDWISVPLVYTQVVTIAVYSFFVACLFGRQYLYHPGPNLGSADPQVNDIDYYIPFFTIFQFFFYVGWLKVAEAMISPFGTDDEDFEVNWVLDRNLQVGYMIVDRMYKTHPKLTKDAFWNSEVPDIPYTQAAASYRGVPYFGSTQAMDIPDRQAEWNVPEPMEPIDEETQIGIEPKISITNNLRSRKIRDGFLKRKSENSVDNLSVSIRSNSSDEIDDDERSTGSRQADEKKKTRLRGLMQGFSRSTLFKFGSKMSIESGSTRRNNIGKSPPPGFLSRQFSIPGLAPRSRMSTMKQSRASSPQQADQDQSPIYDLDDTLKNVEDLATERSSSPSFNDHVNAANSGFFPPRNADNFTAASQIDVPPALKEEPEPENDNSGSGSDCNTLPKLMKSSKASVSSAEKSMHFMSSQTPLIPPEK